MVRETRKKRKALSSTRFPFFLSVEKDQKRLQTFFFMVVGSSSFHLLLFSTSSPPKGGIKELLVSYLHCSGAWFCKGFAGAHKAYFL